MKKNALGNQTIQSLKYKIYIIIIARFRLYLIKLYMLSPKVISLDSTLSRIMMFGPL